MSERRFDATDPANFEHWIDDRVRFCDQDASGHINNTAVAQYVENGRVAYAIEVLQIQDNDSRFIAARLAIDFLRESHYPGIVRTGTRVARIGNKSVTTLHGVFKDELCIATAECVLVHLHGAETIPLTGPMRESLSRSLLPA